MPIKLPNLDDRTFADLVAEAHTLIPVHAPKWTNHNESDPGITLVELLAYFTEMQIYRLNRVTDANVCAFLRLIDGVERTPSKRNRGTITRVKENTEVALRDEVRAVVLKLRQQDRAVSCEDFERLAREADPRLARAYCIPRRNLASNSPYTVAEAHVSVVVHPIKASFETVLWSDGKGFSNVTEESAGSDTIPLWTATSRKDSPSLYLGSSTVFEFFRFDFAETGSGYSLTFEYFDGKNWTKLTTETHRLTDGTSNWSANGSVSFTCPPDWRQKVENKENRYWLRISSNHAPTRRAITNRIFCRDPVELRDVVERVSQYLEPRRLLTTRVHVVGPRFVTIGVHVNLALKPDVLQETVEQEVKNRLNQFFDREVWPFGRNVYVSEIYRQLDRIPGVDFVTKITNKEIITAHDVTDNRRIEQGADLVAIRLNPDELVKFSVRKSDIEVTLLPGRELRHEAN